MFEYGVLVENSKFKLHYEIVNGNMFMHLDVYKYDKHIKKEMLDCWESVKKELSSKGWERVFTYSGSKHFIKLFGGELVSVVAVDKDKVAELHVWELQYPS